MQRSDQALVNLLKLILKLIKEIQGHIKGADEKVFLKNRDMSDLCILKLQIIGEIAGKIRKSYPDFDAIPYKKIIGLRNIIAHDYFGVNREDIWVIVNYHIPKLEETISNYIKNGS